MPNQDARSIRETIAVALTVEAIPSRTCCSEDRLGPSPLQLPTHGRSCRPVAWHCQAEWSCRPGGSRSLRQTHAVRPKAGLPRPNQAFRNGPGTLILTYSKTGRPGAQAGLERAFPFDEKAGDLRSVFWMRHGQASTVTRGAGTSSRSIIQRPTRREFPRV